MLRFPDRTSNSGGDRQGTPKSEPPTGGFPALKERHMGLDSGVRGLGLQIPHPQGALGTAADGRACVRTAFGTFEVGSHATWTASQLTGKRGKPIPRRILAVFATSGGGVFASLDPVCDMDMPLSAAASELRRVKP